MAEARKPGITDERATAAAVRAQLTAQGLKACSVCDIQKPFDQFSRRVASPDGLAYKCRACYAAYAKDWRSANPTAFKGWEGKNREHRQRYNAKWRAENKEQLAANYAAWARANKPIVNALIAKRNAAKKRATPPWFDQMKVQAFYERAAFLTALTGIRHEVDHYYPLQGELVCGLHCDANLQILTKTENIRKSNRMPEDVT